MHLPQATLQASAGTILCILGTRESALPIPGGCLPRSSETRFTPLKLLPLWDHAGHIQNDGGDGEGEEGESEREEDSVGHCGVSVCCPAGYALTNKLQKTLKRKQAHF
jgi:hypothetical protein